MEDLKPIEQVTEPDPRTHFFVLLTKDGPKKKELADVHRAVSAMVLNEGVPEEVKNHFATAKNLALYSWYYYPFHVTADFMSMVSIEYALKIKSGKKRGGLANLTRLAVDKGWIKDEGFRVARTKVPGEKPYVETLAEVLPRLRNGYAHGSSTLHNHSLAGLAIAADFINQLYPA